MAGHDINYIGLTGVLAAIGTSDHPLPPLNLVGDYGGGAMFAVVGALAGIIERSRTGRGGVVDVAMVDGASRLLGPIRDLLGVGMWTERRGANLLDGGAPFYRTYRTSDGRFVAVGALEPRFYDELIEGLGLDPGALPDRFDPDAWPDLHERFADAFAGGTAAHWAEVFDGTDACVTPVLTMSEVAAHPHAAARGIIAETPGGPVAAPAPRFSAMMDAPAAGSATPPQRPSDGARAVSDTLGALGVPRTVVDELMARGAAYRV
jgi:alpha-methylacyl-CoA racemase